MEQIKLSQWVYRMSVDQINKIQVKRQFIDGFGYSHYRGRMPSWNRSHPESHISDYGMAISLFRVPDGAEVCADVGCGPFCGIFAVRLWKTMYAIDPLWHAYESSNLIICPNESIKFIEDYAQMFSLPEKADVIFSINALNHSGDLEKSIENIMSNLNPGGLFFLHLNHRLSRELNSKHPMEVSEESIENILKKYNVVEKMWKPDPLQSGKGRPTIVATLKA